MLLSRYQVGGLLPSLSFATQSRQSDVPFSLQFTAGAVFFVDATEDTGSCCETEAGAVAEFTLCQGLQVSFRDM